MSEFPFIIMKIPCNQFLSWRCLCVILKQKWKSEDERNKLDLQLTTQDTVRRVTGEFSQITIIKGHLQGGERLFQLLGEEQRNHHE